MTTEDSWPPQSARQALLSSPSGRKKYAECSEGLVTSRFERPPATPNLLNRLRLAKHDAEHFDHGQENAIHDDDEDEETLKLKLAAIEAKLKLKRLQAQTRKQEEAEAARSNLPDRKLLDTHNRNESKVEIGLSPTRRPVPIKEQKSPSRVLLGIDKGVKGADISLRRSRVVKGEVPLHEDKVRPDARSRHSQIRGKPSLRQQNAHGSAVQSFSERMSAVRDHETKEVKKRESVAARRATRFTIDAAEMENFRLAAEEAQQHIQQFSTAISTSIPRPKPEADSKRQNHQSQDSVREMKGDSALFEGFSGINLASRILPHSFLKRTLPTDQYTIYRIPDLLKNVVSPAYELPDEVGTYVVFGIIASKSNPLDQKIRADDKVKMSNESDRKWDDGSQNRRKFMALTLTDLTWTIDLFLFDTALPRYHRLGVGTVVAILNPSIMRPKRGREDSGAFSLSLHDGDDTVLEIGTAKDLKYCTALKKGGAECGRWVNGSKTEICEYHLNEQVAKMQAGRMGVNSSASGYGRGWPKEKNQQTGPFQRGYDRETESHYYVSSSGAGVRSAPIYQPDVSTVRMLDASGDPFVAEGQFSRDKEALLRRRLASQEKERSIAKKLATLGSGSSAGANYMRRKVEGDISRSTKNERANMSKVGQNEQTASQSSNSHQLQKEHVQQDEESDQFRIGKRRAAHDIRLSPIKKTRFLTDQGIKLAGRESIGIHPSSQHSAGTTNTISSSTVHKSAAANDPCLKDVLNDDDDDDDLDII